MLILFILGLVIGGAAVIFSLGNTDITTVTFLSYQLTGELAYVLLATLGLGILVAVLMLLPEYIVNGLKNKRLQKEVERLEEELRKQKELTVFAKNVPPTEEDIEKIEQGAIHHRFD